MAITWNGDEAKQQIAHASAAGLLRAAVFFQTTFKNRLNKSNPRPYLDPSKPGEYPRARTGFGRSNVMYEPTSVAEVEKKGYVRIGFSKNAWYMAYLEVYKGRKGMLATLRDILSQLAALATSGAP